MSQKSFWCNAVESYIESKTSAQYIYTDVELPNDKAVLSQTVQQCASLSMYIKN